MPRDYLLGLLVVFCLLAMGYSLTTPLFEAPDEPWHYAYVRWLAEGHGLPRLDDVASGAGQEVAQPPLYYATAALVSIPFADDDLSELFWHNPQFGYQAGGTVNDNKNMLVHTDRERFPWRGAVLAIRVARLVSLAFGLITVGATFGLAREALPDRSWLALGAAAVVAFTPQFLFISGVVSNDSAAAAVCTSALWVVARIVRMGATNRRAAVAGLTLGLALLSKTSALLLMPLVLVVVVFFADSRIRKWRQAALTLSIAGAVGGWWYIRNWILFDDPLGTQIHINTLWRRTDSVNLADLLSELPQVFRSFWGAFGWGHVELLPVLYSALALLMALSLAGWMRRAIAAAKTTNKHFTGLRSFSASTTIFLLAAGWCLSVLVALLRWMQQVHAPHGRLLFPALGALALLLAVGWSQLRPWSHRPVATYFSTYIPVGILCALSLITPFAFIRPAFAKPRLISPAAATQKVTPHTLVYDAQVRLLGYWAEPASVVPGEQVQVTLCWEALRRMDHDYTLFIHLLGQDNARVAERTTYPGQGRFPTSQWPPGRAFCDAYGLRIQPWAPTPQMYALEVGLYDAMTGWRLPAQDESGQVIAPPTIGLVRVIPAMPSPQPEHPLDYELGEQIALIGYASSVERVNALADTSKSINTLTLYWRALQVPQGDYKVFVHLLDQNGTIVAQDDARPRSGSYPTWAWQPGDLVPDSHQVELPDTRPPGPYHWAVGMYHPETYDRLPVMGPQGALPDGTILLEKAED